MHRMRIIHMKKCVAVSRNFNVVKVKKVKWLKVRFPVPKLISYRKLCSNVHRKHYKSLSQGVCVCVCQPLQPERKKKSRLHIALHP